MTSRKLVGRGVKWSAGVALLLGCGATDPADPTTQTAEESFGRHVVHRPSPPPRGPRPGHGPGRGPGHHHGHGPGQPGHGGSSNSPGAGGSSGSVSSAGQSNGSGAATSTGGTGSGSAGFFGGGGYAGGINPGVCGDNLRSGYEECEDGNTADGDGCDANCQVEPGFACRYDEACYLVACGDGLQDNYPTGDGAWVYENCDDGNTASGDGCSAECEPEPGFLCDYPGSPCKDVVCGDGSQDAYYVLVEGTGGTGAGGSAGSGMGGFAGSGTTGPYIGMAFEGCDDGNTASSDGCSATCELESGWICDRPGQACRQPRCGDGFTDFVPGAGGSSGSGSGGTAGSAGMFGAAGGTSYGTYEECDDHNAASNDGCSASCTLEPGYSCLVAGEPCKLAVCGDGVADYPVEDCDDGNTQDGDSCDGTCHYDYGSGGVGGFMGVGGGVTAGTGFVGGSAGQGGRSSRGG